MLPDFLLLLKWLLFMKNCWEIFIEGEALFQNESLILAPVSGGLVLRLLFDAYRIAFWVRLRPLGSGIWHSWLAILANNR